ncbi:MAG: tRNA (adenosine(37)-N6)-dimethylallyltransferase MiaA [Bacteroidales bacterium]
MTEPKLIVILGPTASGKTSLAVKLARQLNTEIISADSRQVYRGMDIGTGKDIKDYYYEEYGQKKCILYHLIDIAEAGEKYNICRYQKDFSRAYNDIIAKHKIPILCGGSGLYIEAATRGYSLPNVPANLKLRKQLEKESTKDLIVKLASFKTLHNSTDYDSRQRLIRALEIAIYEDEAQKKALKDAKDVSQPKEINISEAVSGNAEVPVFKEGEVLYLGVQISRDERIARIDKRLLERIQEGMVDEGRALMKKGLTRENLVYYGLEYKFVTQYLCKDLTYRQMKEHLAIAIHQFAKRQMTWFRGMERKGINIEWIDIKKTVWMLYPKTTPISNNAFNWFRQEAFKQGLFLEIFFFEDFEIKEKSLKIFYRGIDVTDQIPKVIIMRGYEYSLSGYFEALNKTVVNTTTSMKNARDKYTTYKILSEAGIPTPDTVKIFDKLDNLDKEQITDSVNEFSNHKSFSYENLSKRFCSDTFIVKAIQGSKGEGVYLVSNKKEMKEAISQISENKISEGKELVANPSLCIAQKYIDNSKGRDIRVWVINNKAVAWVLRYNEKSFKSNFAAGGDAIKIELPNKVKILAEETVKTMELAFAGVDILINKSENSELSSDEYLICEVNGNAGFRTLNKSKQEDVNLPGELMEYISLLLK